MDFRFFLRWGIIPCLMLAAMLSNAVARADTPAAEREIRDVVGSEFALAAQAAAKELGDLTCRLPLPSCDTAPVIDGELGDDAWKQATEVPLPCVRRGTGRIVAEARLLALRAKERLFLALVFPHKIVQGPLLGVETEKGLKWKVNLGPDGKITASADKAGQAGPWGLRSAAARGDQTVTVELELALPAGEVLLFPAGEVLGLRPPNPLANLKVHFRPTDLALRLMRSDDDPPLWFRRWTRDHGVPDQVYWRLETTPKPSALATYTSVRLAGTGQGAVSFGSTAGSPHLRFREPASVGIILLKFTVAPGGSLYSFAFCASYVPDLPLLLTRTKALAQEEGCRPPKGWPARLKEIEEQSRSGLKQLGTGEGQESWDEAFRAAMLLRRELALPRK